MRIIIKILFFLASYITLYGQSNTVGLLSYDSGRAYDGYNLLYPHNQPTVYLLDNCGMILHSWPDSSHFVPGNTAYLLPDGRLVKTKRPRSIVGDAIWAGGGGATVEIRDWDNNLEWSYTLNDSTARLHHDVEVLPNGNILMLAWESISIEDVVKAGRDTSGFTSDDFWPDYVFEVNPETDEIVWEWHAWDHLIQDFDPDKANFGNVDLNPRRFNINYDSDAHPDWMHCNSIDYDRVNDLILLSCPFFDELWIIDHSTSTLQAKGRSGGLSGKGGDLMWRWGNNRTFDFDTETDQQVFFSHDANFIDDPWIEPFDPLFGKIALFNNRVGEDFSLVNVIDPSFDMYTHEFPFINNRWEPESFLKTIAHPDPQAIFSSGLSSAQYLPNGNFLICAGRTGYSVELTPENEVVWEYITPLKMGFPANQGDSLTLNQNLTFRIKRYPVDYSAFEGREFSTKVWIELNPDSSFCDRITSTSVIAHDYNLSILPNPAQDMITINWNAGVYVHMDVINIQGQTVYNAGKISGGRKYLFVNEWLNGLYFIRINGQIAEKLIVAHRSQ